MTDNVRLSLFSRLKTGLKKTSSQISSLFTGNHIDDNIWDELHERLILTDAGAPVAEKLLESARKNRAAMKTPQNLLDEIKKQAVLLFPPLPTAKHEQKPWVILVIGVNGSGKTTTIAKLAKRHKENGKKVLLCAADTFRAAAIEQLKGWADRIGIPLVCQQEGSDPAAVAFDAVVSGCSGGKDIIIIDTAGRLHTKHNLMEELKKIERVIGKANAGSPQEVLLVLDGTAGQNALAQAKAFNEAISVTSIVITKLDGTAKGGIAMRIAKEINIPVKYVGLGEQPDDLILFDPEAYVEAVFSA
ncbi:MAG: signal recognition particle-docking protein FtsY [Deferribacteraceae bacterium]|jgi:fused signal recognition particle receptor|nr:signal recognition particle-docking protein FtsY [Deferribacteraceae bacterium]